MLWSFYHTIRNIFFKKRSQSQRGNRMLCEEPYAYALIAHVRFWKGAFGGNAD